MQKPKAPPSAAQAELDKLQQELQERQKTLFSGYEALKTDEEKTKLIQSGYQAIYTEFWPRYQKLIAQSQGGVQVRARLGALQILQMGQKRELIACVMADLVRENRDLAETASAAQELRYMVYQPGAKAEVLKSLAALGKSKNATVRAATLYAIADITKETDSKKAAALYREVVAKYPTTSYARSAKAAIFEAERLQVGMIAPEMEGLDQDGKLFRLSEYRGKVVVLDFWGFW